MRSRPKLTTTTKAVAAAMLLLLALTACQHPTPAPPKPPPKVIYSETYDREIKEIMDLANQNRWEEAQGKANALYEQDPKNQILARVHTWVEQQAQQLRAQALEDKIRSIDAKNSALNPTVKDMLTEQKDRGLPPRKDVRDAVDRMKFCLTGERPECSYSEIARRLGMTEGAVKVAVHRLRRRYRETLRAEIAHTVYMANSKSRSNEQFGQSIAARFPVIMV
jgi:hypothetical protein